MNKKKVMLALAGVAVLISACEKEVAERGGGEKVAVNFVVNSGEYEASEGAMRGANLGLRTRDSETVITHLTGDYYLYAKLVADGPEETTFDGSQLPEEGLRAVTTSYLMPGQLVHIVAYDPSQGGAVVDEADFYAGNGGHIFVVDPSDPLEVEPGVYDFAAYSYYHSTDALSASNIDPTVHDLVWGEAKNQTITAGGTNQATVPMTLKHLFSRVRVKIKNGVTDAAITGIGAVTIAGGQKVNLTVKDGSLASAGAVTQSVGNWEDEDGTALGSTFSEEVIVSDYALFYPSPTRVTIGSISMNIGGKPLTFSDHSATFTQALVAGQHYTLVVDLKSLVWAGGNVYYSQTLGTMTFDEINPAGDPVMQRQGMFFQWGSLVGTAPYGGNSPIPIAIPPVKDGDGWDIGRTVTSSPWGNTWANIPRITAPTSFETDGNYLQDHPDFANYKGDICVFLSGREGVPAGNWRMPNRAEMMVGSYVGSYSKSPSTPTDVWGGSTTSSVKPATFASTSRIVRFPASGYRTNSGSLMAVLEDGAYWSGSAASGTGAYYMLFKPNSINHNTQTFACGRSIRCVKS